MQQPAQNPSYQRLPLPNVKIMPVTGRAAHRRLLRTAAPQAPPLSVGSPPPPSATVQPLQSPSSPHPLSHQQKQQKVRKELQKAIGHANEVLAQARTVFPFTLFPDTITIDRGKLTISHHFFFRTAEVTSIRIEDVLNAVANVGPFFGSLKIATRYFGTDKVYNVNYLRRADTIKIKRILHGYIIALRKGIDCSALPTTELSHVLQELGADSPEEKL